MKSFEHSPAHGKCYLILALLLFLLWRRKCTSRKRECDIDFVLKSDWQLLIYYDLLYKKVSKVVVSLVLLSDQFIFNTDSKLEEDHVWAQASVYHFRVTKYKYLKYRQWYNNLNVIFLKIRVLGVYFFVA